MTCCILNILTSDTLETGDGHLLGDQSDSGEGLVDGEHSPLGGQPGLQGPVTQALVNSLSRVLPIKSISCRLLEKQNISNFNVVA